MGGCLLGRMNCFRMRGIGMGLCCRERCVGGYGIGVTFKMGRE